MKRDFTQIPNEIIKDKNIPDGAFRTYLLLKSYKYGSSKVFPSQNTLAAIRGKTKKTIITHLKILKDKNLITYKKRGFSASNQYELIGEENYTNDNRESMKNYTSKMKKNLPLSLRRLQPNNTETNNTKMSNKGLEKLRKKLIELGLKKP